jgi:hypothetical protein
MSVICEGLHLIINKLERFSYPFPLEKLPHNGICIFFEKGEPGHSSDRIVLANTHTGDDQLIARLGDHFERENKDRSIFRKHIGRSFLSKNKDPFLEDWERDLTSRKAREQYAGRIDFRRQGQVEKEVSEYLRDNFSFVVVEADDKSTRLELRSRIASTVSLCSDCGPSLSWMGNFSPIAKIKESGLWQVQELYKKPFSAEELNSLDQLF